jgi:hypothetical protein
MIYRIHEIKCQVGEDSRVIPERIREKLKKPSLEIKTWRIVKESIDARDKGDIRIVYSVDFEPEDPEIKLPLDQGGLQEYQLPERGTEELRHSPVIAGFGPAGIFAGLILAEMGLKPIILEKGKPMDERIRDVERFWEEGILDPESNVQFGEGGAGTFSDGKLTTGIKDKRIQKVLMEFHKAGADEDILYRQKPHIGTDRLRGVVVNLRKKILSLGGQIRFSTPLTGIRIVDGRVTGVEAGHGEWIETDDLILTVGHSARDTFRQLYQMGIPMEAKPYSMGFRIQHTQSWIDQAQYGKQTGLPPAEYKLSGRSSSGRGVYTFCMCPGGEVISASSHPGCLVTNGMSYHARDGKYANSGLLVDVRVSDFSSESPLAGLEFQEHYEQLAFRLNGESYEPLTCRLGDYQNNEGMGALLRQALPPFVNESILEVLPALGRKLRGFDSPATILKGIETRSSSPVRILRDEAYQSEIRGLYPGGEGAGYSGGITSAAVDGIRIAEQIIRRYKEREERSYVG